MSKTITNLFTVFFILAIGLSACSSSENPTQVAPVETETSAVPTLAVEATRASDDTSQTKTIQEVDYPLVETGQGFCYNSDGEKIDLPGEGEAFYGQDAQFTGRQVHFTGQW